MNALIYDIEIANAIVGKGDERRPGISYCEGWGDHAGMGIACIGVYDAHERRPRVFGTESLDDFMELCDARRCLVSFNGLGFDNKVLRAKDADLPEGKCYDILRHAWRSQGRGGLSLDALCESTLGEKKSGDGALAPVLWQQGKQAAVIDYCLRDVDLTWKLFRRIAEGLPLVHPATGKEFRLPAPLDGSLQESQ